MNYYIKVLKNYANFSGRARRSEYWSFVLPNYIVLMILRVVGIHSLSLHILASLLSLVLFLPTIAVGIRRMHDIDKCGWYILIPFYDIYLCCLEGTSGPNSYGPDSKTLI